MPKPITNTQQTTLSDEPYYEPIADEVAVFAAAYRNQLPVLLKGPTGCGKTRFIEYAVRQLGLANVRVEKSRIEEYAPPDKFTTIVSRAFSSLDAFARVCHPLLRTDGYLLAMKGKLPKEEIDALNKAQWEVSSQPVDVPGLDAERHMVMMGPLS